ncbi:hypothetical protein L218DRAFT_949447 [Marasmius fiardii PR-910]|nr:hypothetical protein L218DRAFT_949447 [Marasmius fiardii PR-910]
MSASKHAEEKSKGSVRDPWTFLSHIQKHIAKAKPAIGSDVNYLIALFDGKPWNCPDTIISLTETLVTLLKGSLVKWEDFTVEFSREGAIACTPEQNINHASMAKTINRNKSAFGGVSARLKAMSLLQRLMCKADEQHEANIPIQMRSLCGTQTQKYQELRATIECYNSLVETGLLEHQCSLFLVKQCCMREGTKGAFL